MSSTRPLTPEEQKRLERRRQRTLENQRGRKNPSRLPAKLARTSAFAPRRQGLITDSNFVRMYEVPGYSVVEVRGRELGSQHRDAIYAVFRLKGEKIKVDNPNYRPRTFTLPFELFYETRTTWRELLKAMGRTQHVNNVTSLQAVFTEIQQVVLIVHEGLSLAELEKARTAKGGQAPDTAGVAENMISKLTWDGMQLDSAVVIRFGQDVLRTIEKAHLVSINAEVQFRLKSDHAKVFWPFIDSQPNHAYIEEKRLAQLAGRTLWGEGITSAHRAQFRKECREAFKDMVAAGGLLSWTEETTGSGFNKSKRYGYEHATLRPGDTRRKVEGSPQASLPFDEPAATARPANLS